MSTIVLQSLNRKYFHQSCCIYTLSLINKIYGSFCYETSKIWGNVLNNDRQIRCKSYNRFLDYSKVPELQETDLEEKYVKGSGPGGQATNKTCNAVVLKHKPSGLIVKCHESRSLWQNKKVAREILLKKLDNLINGEDSLQNQEERLIKKSAIKRKQKQKKLATLKNAFKERENLK